MDNDDFSKILEQVAQGDRQKETLFWYNVLYSIGSYMVESARSLQQTSDNPIELGDTYDDPLTRVFCGYWILYTIDSLTSQKPSQESNSTNSPNIMEDVD